MKILRAALILGAAALPRIAGEQELEELWDFINASPEDFNLTEADWNQTSGYNMWMPQYVGGDPTKKTFAMMTGGCIPVEEGGDFFYQDGARGFLDACAERGIECKCRPIIRRSSWNVPLDNQVAPEVFKSMHHCSWEIRRILDEHRRGLIDLAGISAKCDLRHPQIYNEARELGVPIFLLGANPLTPEDEDYGLPEPEGYIGTDQRFLGQTMARLLKQLKPGGSIFAFIMQWNSPNARRIRDAFIQEMEDDPSDDESRATWREVTRYPYEQPYNISIPCHHMTCAMNTLVEKTNVDSYVYLYETPLRNSNYTNWVDSYRSRGLTMISRGTVERLELLNTDYLQGLVGDISYEMGKRSLDVLMQAEERVRNEKVLFPDGDNFFPTKLISYSVIPLDLDETHPPEFDANLLGGLSIVGYVCFGITMVSAILCAIWTFAKRQDMVVKAAQPFFLLILLSGIVIFASTIIPLSFDDNGEPEEVGDAFAVGVCMSQPWLAFTGFTIIFSALFSKTWRVNRLFHAKQGFTRVQVSAHDVLAPFAVIFGSNVIVLACWSAIDPLTYQRLSGDGTDFWNREIESYGACRSDTALAFLVPLAVINFATLGVACWQAFEARNIQSAFSESKYIAYSVASLFQAFLTGFPIVVIVKDEPRAFYLVLTLMIFVLSEGILLLIFLPKILMAYRFSKLPVAEQRRRMSEQIAQSNNKDAETSSRFLSGSGKGGSVKSIPATGSSFFHKVASSNEDVIVEETSSNMFSPISSSEISSEQAQERKTSSLPAISSVTLDSQVHSYVVDETSEEMKAVPEMPGKDAARSEEKSLHSTDVTAVAGTSE